jgi:hypothetical protein
VNPKQPPSQRKDPPLADAELGENQGEGNVEADRHYDEKAREFVRSGRVDEAARRSKPESSQEADEIRQAEEEGRARAKGEDPAVRRR